MYCLGSDKAVILWPLKNLFSNFTGLLLILFYIVHIRDLGGDHKKMGVLGVYPSRLIVLSVSVVLAFVLYLFLLSFSKKKRRTKNKK